MISAGRNPQSHRNLLVLNSHPVHNKILRLTEQ